MKDNGIEDIVIGNDYNSNKKGKKGIIIIFIILLLILIGMIAAYVRFMQPQVTAKELFVKNLLGADVENVLDNKIYTTMLNRVLTESTEITTNINYTSTLKDEALEGIDLSKFVLELTNKNDVNNSKAYGELNINYSGNEVLQINLLSNKEAVAIKSDEIVNRYVGVKKDSLSEITGINFDYNNILSNLKKIEEITIVEDKRKLYIDKYMTQISKNISEENFSMQDNYIIQKENESSSATAYTLKLSQEELKTVFVDLLTTLKNDEELLKELVTGKEESKTLEIQPKNNEEENNNIEPEGENVPEINTDTEEPDINQVQARNETRNEPQVSDDETNTISENRNNVLNVNTNETNTEEANDLENEFQANSSIIDLNPVGEISDENLDMIGKFTRILLGNKVNTTVKKFQDDINKLIEQFQNLEGKGLTFTIYVTNLGTEKINLVLPNEDTLDIELTKKSGEENIIKLTYLYKDKKETDNIHTFSAEDDLISENEEEEASSTEEEKNKNGFSIEIDKIKKEANTSFKIIYSFIENEKITKKLNLNVKTDGTSNSKNIKNSVTISISTEDGQNRQVTFENTIKFTDVSEIEDLTLDNCVFLDELPPEELQPTLDQVNEKIKLVYEEKKERMNFIDTNTHSSLIQQNMNNASSNVTYDEARQALIDRVSTMMTEAIERNEEFTIQNLVDLKIDGYEVSSVVNDKMAVIVVDIYTFNIDTEFNLTDAQ